MTPPMDLLDHATELFAEPPGALERLRARHGRRRRNRRLAAVGTVAAIWVTLALVAAGAFDTPREPIPIDEPSPSIAPSTADPSYELTDRLPAEFPTDLPLPAGVRPVASQRGAIEGSVAQVWFRSEMGPKALREWFDDALPAAGWSQEEPGAMLGGIWDIHVGAGGRSVIVLAKTDPGTSRLIHGSDAFPGRWDLYVYVYVHMTVTDGRGSGAPPGDQSPSG